MTRRVYPSIYSGPIEWYQRFMAGRPVTATQYVQDGSPWTIETVGPWHRDLMEAIVWCPECHHTDAPGLHGRLCSHGRARTALAAVSARIRERAAGHGRGCGCYYCTPPQPGISAPDAEILA